MKPFSVIALAMLLLACLSLPASSLESKFLTVTEKTISLDLGFNFEMAKGEFNTSSNGMVQQEFLINDTATPGAAFISIMSVYDDIMSRMSSDALSELLLLGGISGAEDRGDREIGRWTAADHQGKNVTVHAMSTKDERIGELGGRYDMAVWNLDGTTYAVMVSLLDQNNTAQIIKTLAIS
ncbi:MAG: hypothetical protein A4E49_01698 [Methanosaeta sp. PtaU1.Bin112]|nr:MAG: hypothetical protein A4E49_01698 [Methanosaeta sp. PtaU1.Bin112]